MDRITAVNALQPQTPGSPNDWRTWLGQIVVTISTDSGLEGIGVGGGGAAGVHIVETVLRDLLVGQDASAVEAIHDEMIDRTSFYGRKGLVVMAISGVDLALWDLRGKRAQLPLARVLRDDVDLSQTLPTYRTVGDIEGVHEARAAGHDAIKLHVEGLGDRVRPQHIEAFVAEVRSIVGEETALMIDAFGRWDVDTTLAVAEVLVQHHVEWIEEPVAPDDFASYAELMKRSPIPIAGGEHEYTTAGFQELIERRLHAVLQPDINWCGGMTTLVQVYRMAKKAGLRVCPHRGCEPFALPAIAALDEQPLAESGRPWFHCLEGETNIEAGRIALPQGIGFGVRLRDD